MTTPSHPSLVRIATRGSLLALWQAEHVKARLLAAHPELQIELLVIKTAGDRILDTPLAKIGGKGLFIKELEQAMLAGEADLAVHSMKDVPVELPPELHIPVVLEREDPRDCLLSSHPGGLQGLPQGAIVGTSSLRRRSQLLALRPDLELRDLRGNVTTRLEKLARGEFDGIVLALAGLKRLGLTQGVSAAFEPAEMLPAIAQGVIGIECRRGDSRIERLIAGLNDANASAVVAAERALNARLQGGCQVPIAGHATLTGDQLEVRGLVASLDGLKTLHATRRGPRAEAHALGVAVAEALLADGAGELLAAIGAH